MEEQQQEGLEAPVSEDAFDDNTVYSQYQTPTYQQYWIEELAAEKKEHDPFRERGHKIIKRFTDERDSYDSTRSNYNIFASNVEIKSSSMYARTPVPEVSRRFVDSTDQVSRVAAMILQRNISYELECGGFDSIFKQIAWDRLVPGIGLGWIRLEIDPETQDPTTGEIEYGEQNSYIDYVNWADFYWAPSKTWETTRWIARRVPMCKKAVKDRFSSTCDEKTIFDLAFKQKPTQSYNNQDTLAPKNVTESTIDVYEIWDKTRRLIFWITDSAETPLDVSEDTCEFPDFYPTALPPLGRFTTSNTTPIADYSLVQDQYRELDDLNNRASHLVQALKLRWVYDNSNRALKDLFTSTGELQGIGVNDWAAFSTEKGGLKNSIEFVPLDEIAATYSKLITARDLVKQQIFEIEGISDILRGVAMPYETASATAAKGAASSSRLGVAQHDAADYISRLIRLKGHSICKFYTPNTMLARAGQFNEADQQYIQPALQLLKNTSANQFKLLVSVDSIMLPNFQQEKAERSEFIHAITGLLAQMIPAVKQTPELGPLGISLIKFGVAGFRGASQIEGMIDNALDQLLATQGQAQQQKPPSAEQTKMMMQEQQIRADMQTTQIQENTKIQSAQLQAQIKSMEIQLEQQQLELKKQQLAHQAAIDQIKIENSKIDAAHGHAIDVLNLQKQGD
ncbi:MAG: hypothetical protein V5B36_00855 [Candidatus Accumulibacter sp. UW25]|jgi:hypothetical protein